jgi:hypothetical protein
MLWSLLKVSPSWLKKMAHTLYHFEGELSSYNPEVKKEETVSDGNAYINNYLLIKSNSIN